MMLAQPVSAATVAVGAGDRQNDLGPKYDAALADTVVFWPDKMPLTKVGYFDMRSFQLSYSTEKEEYTFGMTLSKALPTPGSTLPYGFKMVKWLMWIDAEPWNPKYNPAASTLYTIQLTYDGSSYAGELIEGLYGAVLATLPINVGVSEFEVSFSAASIGNLESFWFMPCTVVLWSLIVGSGYWDLDAADPGAVPGQVWWYIPWGNPVWPPP